MKRHFLRRFTSCIIWFIPLHFCDGSKGNLVEKKSGETKYFNEVVNINLNSNRGISALISPMRSKSQFNFLFLSALVYLLCLRYFPHHSDPVSLCFPHVK